MKRYLLFIGAVHCPNGGWRDFWDSFDTPKEAQLAHLNFSEKAQIRTWAHIVDGTTGEISWTTTV